MIGWYHYTFAAVPWYMEVSMWLIIGVCVVWAGEAVWRCCNGR